MSRRLDLVIINRSFWPIYPVIGEALMRFAEQHAQMQSVGVVFQNHADIKKHLACEQRGDKVGFYPCRAFLSLAVVLCDVPPTRCFLCCGCSQFC